MLNAGSHESWQEFYVGNRTAISSSGSDPHLDLSLHCSLPIASDFQHVASDWNTTGVDVRMDPMSPGQNFAQRLELISPDLATWYGNQSVIFLDVPCTGAFRDLTIEGTEESGIYAAVDIVNDYDNSAIDGVAHWSTVAAARCRAAREWKKREWPLAWRASRATEAPELTMANWWM
jgi:hypothetical protein